MSVLISGPYMEQGIYLGEMLREECKKKQSYRQKQAKGTQTGDMACSGSGSVFCVSFLYTDKDPDNGGSISGHW